MSKLYTVIPCCHPMFVKELLYWFLLTDKTRVRIKL